MRGDAMCLPMPWAGVAASVASSAALGSITSSPCALCAANCASTPSAPTPRPPTPHACRERRLRPGLQGQGQRRQPEEERRRHGRLLRRHLRQVPHHLHRGTGGGTVQGVRYRGAVQSWRYSTGAVQCWRYSCTGGGAVLWWSAVAVRCSLELPGQAPRGRLLASRQAGAALAAPPAPRPSLTRSHHPARPYRPARTAGPLRRGRLGGLHRLHLQGAVPGGGRRPALHQPGARAEGD